MPTSHFDRTLLPPARTFYEQELGQLSRPSRAGWAKVRCVFHSGKSPSLNVNIDSGAFHCFGCEVSGGDVLDFTRLLHGVTFLEAARMLDCFRDDFSPRQVSRLKRKRERQKRERIEKIEAERRERVDAAADLRAADVLYCEAMAEHNIELMADLLPRVRQLEARYYTLAGLEVHHEW